MTLDIIRNSCDVLYLEFLWGVPVKKTHTVSKIVKNSQNCLKLLKIFKKFSQVMFPHHSDQMSQFGGKMSKF